MRFHHSLRDDEVKFQRMWADKFYTLNACDYGSPSSRPRQFMADFVRLGSLPPVSPVYPNRLLSSHRHCSSQFMPCIVASKHTHRVPAVYDSSVGATSQLTSTECEVMQGWPPHITNGTHTCLGASHATRLKQVGNALNNSQLYHILRAFTPASATVQHCPAPAAFPNAAALEAHLSTLSDAGLRQWMQKRTAGWEPEPLRLRLKPGQKPYGKPRRGYSVPSGLMASMKHMLQDQVSEGYMRKVSYTYDKFVSPGFVQVKPGRYFPGTNLPMVRLLADCRALNRSCVDAPYTITIVALPSWTCVRVSHL